ncbi:MAG: TonB-dependent receptor [Acidobacteria bacterium]|nr:TonB-dependent receptor [Acidobacteriota bacterium]
MNRMSVFAAAVVCCAGVVWGQNSSASVVGRVTDSTGAVIPGATIRITSLGTNQVHSAASNGTGDFTVPFLPPGAYRVEAALRGFRTFVLTQLTLEVDQVQRVDIVMEVGASAETITVTEAPPVLNTDTGARGEVTSSKEIAELPLDGRNFSDLAYLTGGVLPKGDGGDGAYAVNGARADNFGFVIDGVENTQKRNTGAMINPPIESVQEFKLITSGFAAEYGRYAGGVLSVVTKSGSNQLRGALYEFIRNDVFDARGFFTVSKPKLRRNQYGVNVNGPVRLPKLYEGRDRTFFSFSWDALRAITGKTQRGITPLAEFHRGDFRRAANAFGRPLTLIDPLAGGAPFANNQLPVSRFDPVAAKMAAYYPAPNLAGVNNFISEGNQTDTNRAFNAKGDHQLSANGRLTLAAIWSNNSNFDPVANSRSPLPIFGSVNDPNSVLSYIRYLHTISPTTFLDLKTSFSRRTNSQRWPYSADKDWAGEIGFRGGITNPVAAGLPEFNASGYIILGPAYDLPKLWSYNNYQHSGAITWIKGKHNLKAGGEFLRIQYFSRQYGNTRGRLTFLGRNTNEPFADVLMGWPSTAARQLDGAGPYHLVSNYTGFVQDDFKITPSLTLNLGLRYELMKPPKEKFGAWSMFIPELGKQVISGIGVLPQAEFDGRIRSSGLVRDTVRASEVGLPATITRTDYNNFAPRFGFAWRPLGSKRSVIRGGYGIFYGSSSLYRLDEYSDTYPFSINETYAAVAGDPNAVRVQDAFPAARRNVGGTTSTYGGPANPKTQYLQTYSLTYEHEMGKGTVMEVAFAGSKGTHLQRRYDLNQPGREQSLRNVRPYAGFATISIISDSSNSIYNSGAITVRRRLSRQVFVRAAYTYAKSIDESSNTGGVIQYNFPTAQDSRNLKGERGRSDFDIGHSFAGSFVWSPRLTRNLLFRGWQLSGTSTIYTGQPFTPKVANFNYTNGEASRPDRVRKGSHENPSIDQWFDRTAFPVVPVGSYRFGSSGRNILDGPGTVNFNASLSRRFRFAEQRALQFRVESFNLPNHPNFNLPENRVDIISGGSITRARNSRNFQLGARLEF